MLKFRMFSIARAVVVADDAVSTIVHNMGITPRELSPVAQPPMPFALNPRDLAAANSTLQQAKSDNAHIVLVFDLDDTILKLQASNDAKKVCLNQNLIDAIAAMLSELDTLANVTCHLVSARPEDSRNTEEYVSVSATLQKFTEAVNKAIKTKHPSGIDFAAENIHCFQVHGYVEKTIVTVSEKQNNTVVDRMFGLRETLHRKYKEKNYDGETHDITIDDILRSDFCNKGLFFEKFLLPELQRRHKKHVAIFFDDQATQREAVGALGVCCVGVYRPDIQLVISHGNKGSRTKNSFMSSVASF